MCQFQLHGRRHEVSFSLISQPSFWGAFVVLTLVIMILVIGFSIQHPKNLQDVRVAIIAMKLVPRPIKTQDEFPGLLSSPRCCADVSVHCWSRARGGCPAVCSARRRSGEEPGLESFIRAWYKFRAQSLTASPGLGDLRITKKRLLSCSHLSVCPVWLPLPNYAEDFTQCRFLHTCPAQLSHEWGVDTACQ